MTAADYQSMSADLTEATAQAEGTTEQARLRGLVFDYAEPLPPMPDYRGRSWEPAARHYRDLTEEERREPMSIIREVLETVHTWPADEREFYILREESRDKYQSPCCTGISSDALTNYALGMSGAPKNGQFPYDRGDLGACELTYQMAPPRLKEIMHPILNGYRKHVEARYPDGPTK